MLAKVFSCAVVGLDGVLVEVEVDVGQGQPGMIVVGLPYTYRELSTMSEVTGGTPYGASCVAGAGDTLRMPTPLELKICRYQGEHVAKLAARLQPPE